MSGVDVLAVMDAATDVFDQENWIPSKIAMEEARAAVAELIECAESLSEDASICGMNTSRIDAALRRVKGGE